MFNSDVEISDAQLDNLAKKLAGRSLDCKRQDIAYGLNPFGQLVGVIERVGPDSLRVIRVIDCAPNGEPILFEANLN